MKAVYAILIIGMFLLLLSMERVQKEKTGHRVAALMEDIAFKRARNRYLSFKLGQFKSPGRIISLGASKDLAITEPGNIILIEEP